MLNAKLRRMLFVAALTFAALFSIISFAQDLFVGALFRNEEEHRLDDTIRTTHSIIATKGRLNLTGERQATDLGPTDVIVMTERGLLIDASVNGESDILSSVITSDPLPTTPNHYLTSEIGELWYILQEPILGGRVYVGTILPQHGEPRKDKLRQDLRAFGADIASASKVRSQDVSNYTDGFGVIGNHNAITAISGGLPLHIRLSVPRNYTDGAMRLLPFAGERRAVLSRSFLDVKPPIRIFAFDSVGNQERVMLEYRRFNIIVALLSWATLLIGTGAFLIMQELRNRRQEMSLEEALRKGEGQTIEFKEGLGDVTVANKVESLANTSTILTNITGKPKFTRLAQTITAFSNTNSGTVFIGVADDGTIRGLDATDRSKRDNVQKWLRNIVASSIKPPVFVRSSFIEVDGKIVMRISVPRGNEPIYMFEHVAYIRHMTSVEKAGPAELQSVVKIWQKTNSA